jgi:hypothetical protein
LEGNTLTSTFDLNGQRQSGVDLIASTNFKYGHWYEVWLVASNDRIWVRVADGDDSSIVGGYEIATPVEMRGALYFAAEVGAGRRVP